MIEKQAAKSARTAARSSHRTSDEALVRRVREGDSAAEEQLIRKYKDVAIAKAGPYFIIGADRDDLVQEGMIGLLKAVRRFDPERESSFRTFAEICVDRQLKTAIRQAARLKHNPLNTSVSLNQPPPGEGGLRPLADCVPENAATDPEALLLLKEAFAGIAADESFFSRMEAKVWRLRLEGRSQSEIAQILGKPHKSIDNTLQRIRRKIRQWCR